MDRENYYILLELDIDPPEQDPAKIDAAIKRMQANWSRLRNHPTKGIQAKNYIGLIPEIRKVMSDPELRDAEAKAALQVTQEKQGEVFAEIDRHLALHLSKGYISNQEITKLAELHHIEEDEIRARIKIMEEEKQAELDNQLGLRMAKGYITQEEISKLAKAHGMTEKDIKKRVNVPIRKTGSEEKVKAKSLDKSIEKVINDNLKIVGHSSLYEFLGLPENTSVELLRKTARKKEAEILKIAKKDALVTASGILAGQCSAIFHDQETRASYDISRGRSRLKDLEADIDVAGIDGKIRSQYFAILVKTGQDLGMDADEAKSFIKSYCKKKDYAIEGQEKKKLSKTQLVIFGASLVLLCLLAMGGLYLMMAMQAKSEFEDAAQRALQQKDLEKRLAIYRNYIAVNEPSKYTEQVNALVRETMQLMKANKEKAAFNAVDKQGREMAEDGDYGKALALYKQYLNDFPGGAQTGAVNNRIKEVEDAFETYQFQRLKALDAADTDQRIAAYVEYLANHPNGKHKEDVAKLIWEMGDEYYLFLNRKIELASRQEDWAKAVEYCDSYIRIFENNNAKRLSREKEQFQRRLTDQKAFEALQAKASRRGADFDAALEDYKEYLTIHPQTTAKDKILEQIKAVQALKYKARIDNARSAVRLKLSANKRFAEKTPGIIQDKKTGLTWTMLTSQDELQECVGYDYAKSYADNLNVGGVGGWRLPTDKELETLYKTDKGYPAAPGLVFWSSKSNPRWADGYMAEQVIVVSVDAGVENYRLDSRKCAAVHAVKE